MKSMVFHVPFPLDQKLDGASRLRPNQMLKAFRDLGFEVDVVEGSAQQRRAAIRKIKDRVKGGHRYEFLYSESSTMPTLLTEPHHLPLYPFLDFGFLYWFKRHVGPVGLFYRDAHWKYPVYREQIGWPRALVGYLFYWIDFALYNIALSRMFLPSKRMARILPAWLNSKSVSGLPSGCHWRGLGPEKTSSGKLKLFYVGGVRPPFYGMAPLIRVANRLQNQVELTICARESEWKEALPLYRPWLSDNIRIVHLAEAELGHYYAEADVFALLRDPHDYLSFAVSYKVFETMSHAVPLLVFSHEQGVVDHLEGWGWAVSGEDEAIRLLENLCRDRSLLKEAQKSIGEVSHKHTWTERARQVAVELKGELHG